MMNQQSKGYRWNSLHTRLVYTAESRALAILEIAVHLVLSEDLPADRYYAEIDIPATLTIQEVKIENLPDDWSSKAPTLTTQTIGDDFVFENKAAILKVPGSIVPQECNYLLNPNHPDARKIKVITKTPMLFDLRFKKK